ncbi:MAG TPA: hypothetical protein VE521_08855 [Nitrososphaera sp.]|jgi:hypothetical protein|nr:hypothetical protein [Nitrososphaera sp.]
MEEPPPLMNVTTNATADDTIATIAEEEEGEGEQTTPIPAQHRCWNNNIAEQAIRNFLLA